MTSLSLAVVADIHHGRDTFTKRGTCALPLLDSFVKVADLLGVDAVIDCGDRISDVDADTDRRLMAEVAERFSAMRSPRFHVDGNHDRAFLSEAENDAALGQAPRPDEVDLGDMRLVFWRPDVALTRLRGFSLATGDIKRLSDLLNASEKRTILVSHVPLSGQSMTGNHWFEENPAHARYSQQAAIRAVLAAAPCPIVALAGHVHWNTLTNVDHISHLTLQSLTDCWRHAPHPSGASAHLMVDGETLRWRVGGRDPFAVEVPFPRRRPASIQRLPSFADILDDPAITSSHAA